MFSPVGKKKLLLQQKFDPNSLLKLSKEKEREDDKDTDSEEEEEEENDQRNFLELKSKEQLEQSNRPSSSSQLLSSSSVIPSNSFDIIDEYYTETDLIYFHPYIYTEIITEESKNSLYSMKAIEKYLKDITNFGKVMNTFLQLIQSNVDIIKNNLNDLIMLKSFESTNLTYKYFIKLLKKIFNFQLINEDINIKKIDDKNHSKIEDNEYKNEECMLFCNYFDIKKKKLINGYSFLLFLTNIKNINKKIINKINLEKKNIILSNNKIITKRKQLLKILLNNLSINFNFNLTNFINFIKKFYNAAKNFYYNTSNNSYYNIFQCNNLNPKFFQHLIQKNFNLYLTSKELGCLFYYYFTPMFKKYRKIKNNYEEEIENNELFLNRNNFHIDKLNKMKKSEDDSVANSRVSDENDENFDEELKINEEKLKNFNFDDINSASNSEITNDIYEEILLPSHDFLKLFIRIGVEERDRIKRENLAANPNNNSQQYVSSLSLTKKEEEAEEKLNNDLLYNINNNFSSYDEENILKKLLKSNDDENLNNYFILKNNLISNTIKFIYFLDIIKKYLKISFSSTELGYLVHKYNTEKSNKTDEKSSKSDEKTVKNDEKPSKPASKIIYINCKFFLIDFYNAIVKKKNDYFLNKLKKIKEKNDKLIEINNQKIHQLESNKKYFKIFLLFDNNLDLNNYLSDKKLIDEIMSEFNTEKEELKAKNSASIAIASNEKSSSKSTIFSNITDILKSLNKNEEKIVNKLIKSSLYISNKSKIIESNSINLNQFKKLLKTYFNLSISNYELFLLYSNQNLIKVNKKNGDILCHEFFNLLINLTNHYQNNIKKELNNDEKNALNKKKSLNNGENDEEFLKEIKTVLNFEYTNEHVEETMEKLLNCSIKYEESIDKTRRLFEKNVLDAKEFHIKLKKILNLNLLPHELGVILHFFHSRRELNDQDTVKLNSTNPSTLNTSRIHTAPSSANSTSRNTNYPTTLYLSKKKLKYYEIDVIDFINYFIQLGLIERNNIKNHYLKENREKLAQIKLLNNEKLEKNLNHTDVVIDFNYTQEDIDSIIKKIEDRAILFNKSHSSAPHLTPFESGEMSFGLFYYYLKSLFHIKPTLKEMGFLCHTFNSKNLTLNINNIQNNSEQKDDKDRGKRKIQNDNSTDNQIEKINPSNFLLYFINLGHKLREEKKRKALERNQLIYKQVVSNTSYQNTDEYLLNNDVYINKTLTFYDLQQFIHKINLISFKFNRNSSSSADIKELERGSVGKKIFKDLSKKILKLSLSIKELNIILFLFPTLSPSLISTASTQSHQPVPSSNVSVVASSNASISSNNQTTSNSSISPSVAPSLTPSISPNLDYVALSNAVLNTLMSIEEGMVNIDQFIEQDPLLLSNSTTSASNSNNTQSTIPSNNDSNSQDKVEEEKKDENKEIEIKKDEKDEEKQIINQIKNYFQLINSVFKNFIVSNNNDEILIDSPRFLLFFLRLGHNKRSKLFLEQLKDQKSKEISRKKEIEDKIQLNLNKIENNLLKYINNVIKEKYDNENLENLNDKKKPNDHEKFTFYSDSDRESALEKIIKSSSEYDPTSSTAPNLKLFHLKAMTLSYFNELLKNTLFINLTIRELLFLYEEFQIVDKKSEKISSDKCIELKKLNLINSEKFLITYLKLGQEEKNKRKAINNEITNNNLLMMNQLSIQKNKHSNEDLKKLISFNFEKNDQEKIFFSLAKIAKNYDKNHSSSANLINYETTKYLQPIVFKQLLNRILNFYPNPKELGALIHYFAYSTEKDSNNNLDVKDQDVTKVLIDTHKFFTFFYKLGISERNKDKLLSLKKQKKMIENQKKLNELKIELNLNKDSQIDYNKVFYTKEIQDQSLDKIKKVATKYHLKLNNFLILQKKYLNLNEFREILTKILNLKLNNSEFKSIFTYFKFNKNEKNDKYNEKDKGDSVNKYNEYLISSQDFINFFNISGFEGRNELKNKHLKSLDEKKKLEDKKSIDKIVKDIIRIEEIEFSNDDFELILKKLKEIASVYDPTHPSCPSLDSFRGTDMLANEFKVAFFKVFSIFLKNSELAALFSYFPSEMNEKNKEKIEKKKRINQENNEKFDDKENNFNDIDNNNNDEEVTYNYLDIAPRISNKNFINYFNKLVRDENNRKYKEKIKTAKKVSEENLAQTKNYETMQSNLLLKKLYYKNHHENEFESIFLTILYQYTINNSVYINKMRIFKGPSLSPSKFKEIIYLIYNQKLSFPHIGVLLSLLNQNFNSLLLTSLSDTSNLSLKEDQIVINGSVFLVWFYRLSRKLEKFLLKESDEIVNFTLMKEIGQQILSTSFNSTAPTIPTTNPTSSSKPFQSTPQVSQSVSHTPSHTPSQRSSFKKKLENNLQASSPYQPYLTGSITWEEEDEEDDDDNEVLFFNEKKSAPNKTRSLSKDKKSHKKDDDLNEFSTSTLNQSWFMPAFSSTSSPPSTSPSTSYSFNENNEEEGAIMRTHLFSIFNSNNVYNTLPYEEEIEKKNENQEKKEEKNKKKAPPVNASITLSQTLNTSGPSFFNNRGANATLAALESDSVVLKNKRFPISFSSTSAINIHKNELKNKKNDEKLKKPDDKNKKLYNTCILPSLVSYNTSINEPLFSSTSPIVPSDLFNIVDQNQDEYEQNEEEAQEIMRHQKEKDEREEKERLEQEIKEKEEDFLSNFFESYNKSNQKFISSQYNKITNFSPLPLASSVSVPTLLPSQEPDLSTRTSLSDPVSNLLDFIKTNQKPHLVAQRERNGYKKKKIHHLDPLELQESSVASQSIILSKKKSRNEESIKEEPKKKKKNVDVVYFPLLLPTSSDDLEIKIGEDLLVNNNQIDEENQKNNNIENENNQEMNNEELMENLDNNADNFDNNDDNYDEEDEVPDIVNEYDRSRLDFFENQLNSFSTFNGDDEE